jgi:putative transposase
MKDYKHTSHTIYDCKYHIVWITKYRYKILTNEVWDKARELLREIAIRNEMKIYAWSINRDHVHMLLSIPPNISVSKAVQILKWTSSRKLFHEFPQLKKQYWWQHLWARWYWVATSWNVTDEVWKKYIDEQKVDEPDDDFRVL